MAKISLILKKAFNLLTAVKEPSQPTIVNMDMSRHTPFERELYNALHAAMNTSNLALLVTLKKDSQKGYMPFQDDEEAEPVLFTHQFEIVGMGQNPYAVIEDLDYAGQSVMMAFDLETRTPLRLQLQGWTPGSIDHPLEFMDEPAICLPARSTYQTKKDIFIEHAKDASSLARQLRAQGRPYIQLATVNGMHIS